MHHLASGGFRPRVALDIGAHRGEWARAFQRVFPGCRVVCFEADAAAHASHLPPGSVLALLGARDGQDADFYTLPGGSTGASVYRENTRHFASPTVERMRTRTLDSLFSDDGPPAPPASVDFVKLDVQGSELDVLEGAQALLKAGGDGRGVPYLLLECSLVEYNAGAPLVAAVVARLAELGYRACDVWELHYLDGALIQLDLLFVRH